MQASELTLRVVSLNDVLLFERLVEQFELDQTLKNPPLVSPYNGRGEMFRVAHTNVERLLIKHGRLGAPIAGRKKYAV